MLPSICKSLLPSICKSIHSLQVVRPLSSLSSAGPSKRLSVCVVGSGPAGFYTVDKVPRGGVLLALLCAEPASLAGCLTRCLCSLQLLKRYGDDVSIDLLVRGDGHGLAGLAA